MLKKLLAITTIFILLFAIVGCQPEATDPGNGEEDPGGEETPESKTIMMVTDTGGVNDKSFNQSAWEGLQTLQEDYPDVTFDYIISNDETEYAANLRTAVDSGSDLTWAVGYMLTDAMVEASESLPDAKFGIVDVVDPLIGDNVVQVGFKEQEGSFLVGLIAGMTTESNKLGFIGGMDGELIRRFEVGFRAGVLTANPDAEISVTYAESWSDTQLGKEIANTMYDQGADVIFHASGNVGNGMFEAAKERGTGPEGFWTIGVDRDQYAEAPDNMLTSMMKKVGSAMASITDEYLTSGEFQGGQVVELGLAEDGVGIAPTSEQTIPEENQAEILEMVEEYRQMIIDGELVVPATREELEDFVANLGQ
jgi:basic membrane protein A